MCVAQYMFNHRNQLQDLLPTHDHRTRNRGNLLHPAHRLTKFRHSVLYIGPIIWNSIPPHMQNAPSLTVFKSNLKNYILKSY